MDLSKWQENEKMWWARLGKAETAKEFWGIYAAYLEDVGIHSKSRKLIYKWAKVANENL
jgi:hypothetical protein